jgi:hypothetical protein
MALREQQRLIILFKENRTMMVELSNERVEQILHEETQKTEELTTILRGIYTRYMRLYENYFADIDALNDDKIAELKKYHEETKSLVKYYYMDIPLDICARLQEFDKEYGKKMLGPNWHKFIFDNYEDYKDKNKSENTSEEGLKADYQEKVLIGFYETMDYVFREGFGTESKTTEEVMNGFSGLFFGK